MEPLADVLLLHAVLAWCEDCGAEQLLLPVDDEGQPGLCCSVCDAAVFLLPADEVAPRALRRTA